ncbi:S-adenosylmethionine decarboxylase proenzyme-like, partial [Trifolium medium]|nr:S-adenosylmethionine decarboxylase proenzyme-like [Trifolium medium]
MVRVLVCFQPTEFFVAAHVDNASKLFEEGCMLDVKVYCREESSHEGLGKGGSVVYQKFVKTNCGTSDCGSPRSTLKCWKDEDEEE